MSSLVDGLVVGWDAGWWSLGPAGALEDAGQRNASLVLVVHAQVARVLARVFAGLLGQFHDDVAVLGPVVDGFDDGSVLGALLFVEAGAFGFDASEFFAAGAGAAGYQRRRGQNKNGKGRFHRLHRWTKAPWLGVGMTGK